MFKWMVIGFCLMSGYGTLPCLAYLAVAYYMEHLDNKDRTK